MPNRLRVGVLGLGRRWRRCLTALPGLRSPARRVRAERVGTPPGGRTVSGSDLLAGGAALGLLHAIRLLLGGPPRGVRASAADGYPLVNLLLDAGDGRAAQAQLWA